MTNSVIPVKSKFRWIMLRLNSSSSQRLFVKFSLALVKGTYSTKFSISFCVSFSLYFSISLLCERLSEFSVECSLAISRSLVHAVGLIIVQLRSNSRNHFDCSRKLMVLAKDFSVCVALTKARERTLDFDSMSCLVRA